MAQNPLRQDIIQHWHSFKNPLINDILINLEKLEHTNPKLTEEEQTAIQKLLDYCQGAKAEDVDEITFINIVNQLPAAYMLYMIHKLQTLNSDLIMRIISYAQKHKDEDPAVHRFFQRNMVFEKSQLLGRIFSNHRMETVLSVLD